ncbi:MAG: ABC transporter ATP-binding protein [Candidatus Rokubacteria bacterium GWC2_70_24]|nr:MAG: ABC transporter ATP-binding protein [Candidatus Rokubacteria bacterium GWA2_70_23]OGK87208.1 MAG: ABC transporter ATP-binding protein [Candidatus Rokubacteria bacterium GWC2_70_24]OGK93825.1 MAG: ABC transporter ATP-binding protein [Candidatus Rokubacteria bacterium GWF2_70_14]
MPRLEVRDLHVSYGKVRALQGVTLTVEERQIVSIVGANGAGKSTVLKAIMGLVPVASGEMRFGDRRLDRMSPPGIVGAGVAICPEGRRLFPEMTVQENLMIGAYQRDSRRAALVLGEVYGYFPILTERKRQLAGSLSGGQQQMVAIGRALMSGPQLLLLDEPSLGLAPLVVRDIASIVQRIHARGVSVILVEQNARMALRLSDRAYVMETGRVTLSGTGQELLNNTQVQRFYLGL